MLLKKQRTHLRNHISLETRIAMSLQRLDIANRQCGLGEVYGVVKCTISMIERQFYKMVKLHLYGIFIQIPNEARFRILRRDSEKLHNMLEPLIDCAFE